MQTQIKSPLLIPSVVDFTSWDEWLESTEKKLKEIGYGRYKQNIKHEDFAYWKTFHVGGGIGYMVGIYFYDFRKYAERDPNTNRISVQFECQFVNDFRMDLTVSKDIPLEEFETMAATFYDAMSKYK